VYQTVIFVLDGRSGGGRDAFLIKACKQRSGAGPVKAFVVIENANPQVNCSLIPDDLRHSLRITTAIAEVFSISARDAGVKRQPELVAVSLNPQPLGLSKNTWSYWNLNLCWIG
jgi:hypothetical protein